jgi:hypothetical protein
MQLCRSPEVLSKQLVWDSPDVQMWICGAFFFHEQAVASNIFIMLDNFFTPHIENDAALMFH